jgi:GNAT superfamily N-acetyltransferase
MCPFTATSLTDDRLASRYPREISLADATEVTLTPMVPSDWKMLEDFIGDTPAADRKFFRRDISDPDRVMRWCTELDYQHILPLLAWHEGRIVADAALQREPGLWTAHIGRLRVLVHPDYRHLGLATHLVDELTDIARDFGLHKLVHECAAEQTDLISMLAQRGFGVAARLPDFICDRNSQYHEMVLMVLGLE